MPCTASRDYPAVCDRRFGTICGPCCDKSVLEAFKTSEPDSVQVFQLAENKAGSGADCGYRTPCGIMLFHCPDKGLASREFPASRHTSGEYHNVPGIRSFVSGAENFAQIVFHSNGDAVGRYHERIVRNPYKTDVNPASSKDVIGGQGFTVFKAVGQKYIYTFHNNANIQNSGKFSYICNMEQEKKLYPMHLCTILDKYVWGDEELKLADLGYRDSLVRDGWLAGNSVSELMETFLDRVVGDNSYEWYGRQFPFQIKVLHCRGKFPLQVHPDDTLAAQRYDFLGKEKLWVVLSAGKNASAQLGFRRDTDASEVVKRCADGTISDILNNVALYKGQSLLIHPGTVNSLSGDVTVLEISESSPMDFCLHSWGNELSEDEFDPEFSLVAALDFIDYEAYKAPREEHCHHGDMIEHLAELKQFTVNRLTMTDPLHIYTEKFGSFMVYCCLEGEASVQMEILSQNSVTVIKEGETLLVPAEVPDFILAPLKEGTVLLEAYHEPSEEKDEYINPDVAECLEEDDQECHCGHHHHHHS